MTDREIVLAALDAYASEYPAPSVTEGVRDITAERDHHETWTHVACMIAALRALGVIA